MRLLLFITLLPCLWAAAVLRDRCPDGTHCPIGKTCCVQPSGLYQCCELPGEQHLTDLVPGSLINYTSNTSISTKIVKRRYIDIWRCYDGTICHYNMCCPKYRSAVCCQSTCCPSNSQCCGTYPKQWCCPKNQFCSSNFEKCYTWSVFILDSQSSTASSATNLSSTDLSTATRSYADLSAATRNYIVASAASPSSTVAAGLFGSFLLAVSRYIV